MKISKEFIIEDLLKKKFNNLKGGYLGGSACFIVDTCRTDICCSGPDTDCCSVDSCYMDP